LDVDVDMLGGTRVTPERDVVNGPGAFDCAVSRTI
jgi:hypothetical protein